MMRLVPRAQTRTGFAKNPMQSLILRSFTHWAGAGWLYCIATLQVLVPLNIEGLKHRLKES